MASDDGFAYAQLDTIPSESDVERSDVAKHFDKAKSTLFAFPLLQ